MGKPAMIEPDTRRKGSLEGRLRILYGKIRFFAESAPQSKREPPPHGSSLLDSALPNVSLPDCRRDYRKFRRWYDHGNAYAVCIKLIGNAFNIKNHVCRHTAVRLEVVRNAANILPAGL